MFTSLSTEQLLAKLRRPPPLIRPSVSAQLAPPEAIALMKQCWTEMPAARLSIEDVHERVKLIAGSGKDKHQPTNIVDAMFSMLEKYSSNLEETIRERTTELEDERKRTEDLLYRMLPAAVAQILRRGETVAPEHYERVTIYFSDLVGFTTISAHSTPLEIVSLLNSLYSSFDAVIDHFDVYKVETIGDSYMVASGLPVMNGGEL